MADHSNRKRPPRAYCLRCYAPLNHPEAVVEECGSCGFKNLKRARMAHWTLEPNLVALEWGAKIAAFLICLGVYLYFGATAQGTSKGLMLAVPVVFGVLWATASKITHRMPYFRAGLFWSALILSLGLFPLLWALLGTALFARWPSESLQLLLVAVPFLPIAWMVQRTSKKLERWKTQRILAGS